MTEKNKNYLIGFSLGAAVLCLCGMGYSLEQSRSIRKMVVGATEHIRDMSTIDIDRRMVDQMIQKSVREQAGNACRAAADKIEREVTADMRNRIKQAISNQMTGEINKRVAKEIAEAVEETGREEIVNEVISETTEKLVDKLSDELDNEVGRIGKVFTGIAAAMR